LTIGGYARSPLREWRDAEIDIGFIALADDARLAAPIPDDSR
jgi:hypothetical protein